MWTLWFHEFFFSIFFCHLNKWIAPYGAGVRGSVFNIAFRVLATKFESIETSPGFAWFLG